MASALQQVFQHQRVQERLDLETIKPALSHSFLYVGLVAFTAVGAAVSNQQDSLNLDRSARDPFASLAIKGLGSPSLNIPAIKAAAELFRN